MISDKLIETYNFYCDMKDEFEEKLEKLDSDLARETVSFNKSHIYPIFVYSRSQGDYIIYEPHLKSEFYFNSNYFTNIGYYEYIYYENKVDLSLFNKMQIMYNLKTSKIVTRMKRNQVHYDSVYNMYNIIKFEDCIIDHLKNEDLNKKYAFIFNACSLQSIIRYLIANHSGENYLPINNAIIKIYKKLLKNIFIYLECYVDSDFWQLRDNYNLCLAFDIVLKDYLYDRKKMCLINDVIDFGIERIKQQFQNNTAKKNRRFNLVDVIKINVETDEYNVNIIRSIFSVKEFIDLIIAYIASKHIHYI